MNRLYAKGEEGLHDGSMSWLTTAWLVTAVDLALYTPNFTTDKFLSAIPVGARVATTASALTGKTVVGGVLDAADTTLGVVPGAAAIFGALVIHQSGAEATARLLGYIDAANRLPTDPNGTDIPIVWPAAGIITR